MNVPVADVWLEVDLPGDRWRAAFRLVPYLGQPIVAEVRLFPADHYPNRELGGWRADVLGVRAKVVDGRMDPDIERRDDHQVVGVYPGIRFPAIQHGISGQLLRQIPLGAVRRQVRAFIAKIRSLTAAAYPGMVGSAANDLETQGFTGKPQPEAAPARKARGWPDRVYAQLAAAYVERLDAGSRRPNVDVALRRNLSATQVRDAIHTAVSRGLLTPTTKQGRPGGQLTPRAEQLLKTQRKRKP